MVAQTISAWPLPPTYHRPNDDLTHMDLAFMTTAVESLAAPLVGKSFRVAAPCKGPPYGRTDTTAPVFPSIRIRWPLTYDQR